MRYFPVYQELAIERIAGRGIFIDEGAAAHQILQLTHQAITFVQ